jgi:hypothetical protein
VAFDDGPFDLARKLPGRLLVLALLEIDDVLVLGTSVLDAFARLEVVEATAEMRLFFTPRSTPRSLPSRASVRCCSLGSSIQPRFGDYNDRNRGRVVMRSVEDQKVQAARQSPLYFAAQHLPLQRLALVGVRRAPRLVVPRVGAAIHELRNGIFF